MKPFRVWLAVALAGAALAGGCDSAMLKNIGASKDGSGSRIDTSYPGPFDEELTEAQRELLRERANMQRQ